MQSQISQINSIHKEELRLYLDQSTIGKMIKNRLTTDIEPTYLEELNNPYTGFNNHSIRDKFNYLHANYGKVSESVVEKL